MNIFYILSLFIKLNYQFGLLGNEIWTNSPYIEPASNCNGSFGWINQELKKLHLLFEDPRDKRFTFLQSYPFILIRKNSNSYFINFEKQIFFNPVM